MSIQAGQTFFHNCKGQRRQRPGHKAGWECCGEQLPRYVVRCPRCRGRRV